MKRCLSALACLFLSAGAARAADAERPDPAALLAAQRSALVPLSFMDGVWRGNAWTVLASGEKHQVVQTERVGPFLDGAVKVIEGRGYDAAGKLSFNAFGTISYAPATKSYTLHSYALGYVGDFSLTPTPDGFSWEIPAGPATLRYTAVVNKGSWHEVGERLVPGKPPVQFFEMTLQRLGDTSWPAAGAIPPS